MGKGSPSIKERLEKGFGLPPPRRNTKSYANEQAALALVASFQRKVDDDESIMRDIEDTYQDDPTFRKFNYTPLE